MLPYCGQMKAAMGPVGAGLIALGGVTYTVGAVIYARRWPDPWVSPVPQTLKSLDNLLEALTNPWGSPVLKPLTNPWVGPVP